MSHEQHDMKRIQVNYAHFSPAQIGIVVFAGRHGPRKVSILAVALTTKRARGLVPHLRPKTKAWLCWKLVSIALTTQYGPDVPHLQETVLYACYPWGNSYSRRLHQEVFEPVLHSFHAAQNILFLKALLDVLRQA